MNDEINKLLDLLYSKTGYFSNGNVKNQIKKAKIHIDSINEGQSLNPTIISDPFFTAFKEDPIIFQDECLKFFELVYSKTDAKITPSIEASNLIAKIALNTNFRDSVESKILFCKFLTAILKSKYSNHFSHTLYLPKSFEKLFTLIKNSKTNDVKILISKTIFDLYQFLLTRLKTDTQPEEMHNTEIEKLTKDFVTNQSLIEPYFAPFEPSTTIAEIDYFLALLPPLSYFSEKTIDDQILSQTIIEPFFLLISSDAPILKKMIFYIAISSFYKPLIVFTIDSNLERYPDIVGKLICKIYELAKTEALPMISSIIYDEIVPRFNISNSMEIGTILKVVVGCPTIIIDLARELPDHRTIQYMIKRLSIPPEGKLEPSKYGVSVLYQLLKSISNFSFKLSDQFELDCGNDKLGQILRTKPKSVLKYLIATDKIKNTKNSTIINYLTNSDLSKDAIGMILFSVKTSLLKDFIQGIDVKCPIGVAYRRVFSQFNIPPKQRNVEYALLCFATHYFKSNPGCAKSSDSIYIVAFNTYMLHIDKYFWPPIINFDYFCILNAKGDDGTSFNQEVLREIFDEIGKGKIYPITIIPGIFTPSQMRYVYENIVPKDSDYYIASSIISQNFDSFFNAFRAILLSKSTMEHTKKYALNGIRILYMVIIRAFDHVKAQRILEFAQMTPPYVRQSIAIAAATAPAFVTCGYDLLVDALLDMPDDTYLDTFIGRTESMTMQQIFDLTDAICRIARAKGVQALLVFPDLAYYNRGRPVFAWLGIWYRMHATLVSFARTDLAMAVVDICRQLCARILESAPQRAFSFQQFYVLPLLEIFDQTEDFGVKETVVLSLQSIVRSLAPVLNTAWDTVLQILASAAAESVAVPTVFEIIEEAVRHPLPIKKHVPHLVGVITTLASFFPDRLGEAFGLLEKICAIKNSAGGWTTCVQAAALFAERGQPRSLFVELAGRPMPTASRLFLLCEELPRLSKALADDGLSEEVERCVEGSQDAIDECVAFAVYLAKNERFDELEKWVFEKCDVSKHSKELRENLADFPSIIERLPKPNEIEREAKAEKVNTKENTNNIINESEGVEKEETEDEIENESGKAEIDEEEEEKSLTEVLKEALSERDFVKSSKAISTAIQSLESDDEGAENEMIEFLGILAGFDDIKGAIKGCEKLLLGLIRNGSPGVRKALAPLLAELM